MPPARHRLGVSSVSETVSGGGSLTGAADGETGAFADMSLDCPGACGEGFPYASGTSIELTAHPDLGATFLGWGGACSGSAPTCSFVTSAATTVTASFTPAPLPRGLLPPPESKDIQAVVACEQARACRLHLALLADSSWNAMTVAGRSFTLAPGRRARIGLVLDARGERLLTRRRRLPVTAQLALSVGGGWVEASQGRLTLIA